MSVFSCRVIDSRGRRRELVREAESEALLAHQLARDGFAPLAIRPVGPRSVGGRRYRRSAVIEFTATMATLLAAGLTLRDALEVAQTIYLRGDVNAIVVSLLSEIETGCTVTEALERQRTRLPPIYAGFVRVGERVGSLEGSFQRLARFLTEEARIRDRLVTALIYPTLVLVTAVLGAAGIALFVLPRAGAMFDQLGVGAPARLQQMAALTRALAAGAAGALAAAVVALVAVLAGRRLAPWFRERSDRWLLRLPILGRLLALRENLNLAFALETLTEGGLAVEDALEEASRVLGNRALAAALARARERVLGGGELSRALLEEPVLPERLGRWVAVGERSGLVAEVFGQLRAYWQHEMERWSERFMALVEPVLILAVGVVIVLLVVFFILPLFSAYGSLI